MLLAFERVRNRVSAEREQKLLTVGFRINSVLSRALKAHSEGLRVFVIVA